MPHCDGRTGKKKVKESLIRILTSGFKTKPAAPSTVGTEVLSSGMKLIIWDAILSSEANVARNVIIWS
jgi:hypothetical protein